LSPFAGYGLLCGWVGAAALPEPVSIPAAPTASATVAAAAAICRGLAARRSFSRMWFFMVSFRRRFDFLLAIDTGDPGLLTRRRPGWVRDGGMVVAVYGLRGCEGAWTDDTTSRKRGRRSGDRRAGGARRRVAPAGAPCRARGAGRGIA